MKNLASDLRFALRSFAQTPVFTAVAIASLALGIGANTAVFTLMDQVLVRALPVEDPARLVQLYARGNHYGSNWGSYAMSYPMYRDFRDQNQVFTGMLARYAFDSSLSHGGETERVASELISGNYFEVLGIRAARGRLITPEDDAKPGEGAVAVLSYHCWKTRFGGKDDILGQSIHVNNFPMTVVGVAADGFNGVDLGYSPQVLVPLNMAGQMIPNWNRTEDRRTRWVQVFGRLKDGLQAENAKVSLEPLYKAMIQDEVRQEAFRNATQYVRDRFLESYIEVVPGGQGQPNFRQRFTRPLAVLMGIVGFVLLIACANVANLMLVRAAARQKELAVRLALGAKRSRIVSQLLVESLLLSLAGGVAGMLLAIPLNSYLLSVMPQGSSPLSIHASPDLRVFLFTFLVSVATGVFFGLAPAFHNSKADLAGTLKDQAGSVTSTSAAVFQKGLVVAQVTLSLLLLIGCGLFARSLFNLRTLSPGFETEQIVAFGVNPALAGYDNARSRAFFQNLQKSLAGIPGVRGVAISRVRLLDGNRSDSTVTVHGYQAKDGEDMNPWVNTVSDGYFATLGIPLLAGREFSQADERALIPDSVLTSLNFSRQADRDRFLEIEKELKGPPKYAIVNESFAKYYFKTPEDAIGRQFGFGGDPGTKTDITIVGVARDTAYGNLRDEIPRQVFVPHMQSHNSAGMNAYLRLTMDSAQAFAAIRRAVMDLDQSLPVFDLRTMSEQIDRSLVTERMIAMLSTVFGVIATILATVGLYGVMAYSVGRRTREIGIRMALGAISSSVIGMVMREVLLLIGIGIAVGAVASIGLTRFIEAQLYGLSGTDPMTLGLAVAALGLVAGLAGYIPALRASRVNPIRALRYE
ncbi:MAG: ABC transporter permease [Bryobacterales bacterium]|nr:ABC transporter permease [Bryobacterales bacterium]